MVASGQDANSSGRANERLTIAEAAALLGVHPNTVRNRVKAGIYKAEKVVTDNGQTWMIDRNSILNNPLPKGSQQPHSQRQPQVEIQATQLVQDLLRPFVEDLGRVREELGAERVRREQAEQERDKLIAELEALREARESPETDAEEPYSTHAPPGGYGTSSREAEESLHPRSWWRRFFGLE